MLTIAVKFMTSFSGTKPNGSVLLQLALMYHETWRKNRKKERNQRENKTNVVVKGATLIKMRSRFPTTL